MARYYSCLGVQRVLMPTVLIFCALLRPVGISLVYLIMFFIIPFVPVANKKNIRGSVGAYFIILIAISTLLIVSHIGLQVAEILLGKISVDCNFLEFLLRHIGFVSLRNLSPLDVVEWIIPEIIMFLTSVIFYILLKRLTTDKPIEPHGGDESVVGETHLEEGLVRSNKKTEQISQATMENMKKLGPFISLVTLLLASALRPSVPGGFYFLIYLISGTYWACFKSLRRGFGIVLRFVMIVLVFHIISIISYQTPWPQEHIGNSSLTARLVGLEALCISTCKSGDDIRIIEYSEKFEFDSFLSPISMLLCYYILSLTSNILIQKKIGRKPTSGFGQLENGTKLKRQVSLIRQPTKIMRKDKWNRPTPRFSVLLVHRESTTETPNENTPLVRRNTRAGQNIIKRTSDQRSIASTNIPLETLSEQPEDEEPAASILDQLWYGVLSIVEFVYQNSYIFTNITMMAWSIIYHSWLTFVLLIWANILWMIPNQRKAMLRSSPFIVFYAELLLIAQYIYGMNLTELPSDVDGIKLIQIGFEKPLRLPCAPLLVKSLFTIMFWITLRQLFKEAKEKRQSSVLADMVAPLQMAVGAATADLAPKVDEKKTSKFLQKFGEFFKVVLVKLWIWLLVFVIFLSAITGSKMTGFRICYMALFLFFLLAFQLSWRAWTRIMYGFWLVLITYAMSILILVYTYQFDEVRLIWKDYLNMSKVLRNDLGLESYATKDLFLHLVNPTVIVIMTIIQIHYFHKKFLASLEVDITNIETPASNTTSANFAENVAQQPSSNDQSPTEKSEFFGDDGKTTLSGKLGKLNSLRRMSKKQIEMMFVKIQTSSKNLVEFIWTFLEIHLMKLVYFIAFLFCLSEVCLLHVFFIFMIVIAIMSKTQAQIYISRLMSIIVSALLLTKMIYQVHYIDHGNYNVSCVTNSTTDDGQEFNNAVWFGLRKRTSDEKLASLLKGYILFMIFLTIHAVVIFRQEHMRASRSLPNNRPHVIFANVTRKDAERNIYGLIKYLLNYGYFKFGIEITLIGLVSLIGFRQDIIAILYSVWLCILFLLERSKCSKLWPFLQWFAAIIIPIQYMLFVGVPPILCPKYTWDNSTYKNGLENWAMLPGPNIQNQSSKLIFDFVLLMFICRQARVFSIEKRFDNDSLEFPGGTNKSIIREIDNLGSIPFENPTPDFIANVRNWLDIFKIIVLTGSFWVTLAVVFLAGTNIISLFSIGYLIGSFIFLWQGTDFYLRPIAKILRWWNILLAYNVAVITIKTFLQIAGCFFLSTLEENACWLVHLLGISCIRGDVNESNEPNIIGKCRDTKDVTGLTWDAICFAFLLFQLRIFKSHYICHIINDTKASTILASRGAELIEDLRQKQIQHKAKHEREVLRKIKKKMEKIRANQQKQLKPIEKTTHFDEEVTAPSMRSSSLSCQGSGYHTPIEDDDNNGQEVVSDLQSDLTGLIQTGSQLQTQATSPSSAVMTVSSDGYLEPSRLSFGSPPNSDLLVKGPSSDDSFPVFSPPPYDSQEENPQPNTLVAPSSTSLVLSTVQSSNVLQVRQHRRQSSFNTVSWNDPVHSSETKRKSIKSPNLSVCDGEEQTPVLRRKSFYRRQSSMGASVFQEDASTYYSRRRRYKYDFRVASTTVSRKKPPITHAQAIRAGDYYMFNDLDEKIELDLMEEEKDFLEEQGEISESEKKMNKRKDLLQVYRDIEKNRRKRMKKEQDEAMLRISSSAPQSHIGITDSTSIDGQLLPRRATISDPMSISMQTEFHDEKSEKDIKLSDKPSTSKESEDLTDSKLNKSDFERQEQSKKDEDETELAEEAGLLIRLFEGFMVSIAIRLNRLSRNYRYVMKILAKEKKILKESDGFGAGARKGAGSIWTPFRFIKQTGSSDGDTINTLNSQTDTNEHNTDKLKQSDSDNDAETGTKVIEKDAETIYYTPRQELQPFGVMAESMRKGSVVPEIRILAPSLERGLDESATPSKHQSINKLSSQDDIDDYEDDFTTREHHILIEVLIALWYAILSNTDMVCYLIVFINQVASASLLSLPLPFMVFLWGTLALPRPTKKFWVTLIAYTQLVVLIKFVFQFKVIWSYDQIKRNPLSTDKVIGIEAKDNYAAYDLLLLLILFFHRFVLKSQGLWNFTYKDDIIPDIPTENGSSSHDVTQGAIATKEDLSLITPKESSVDESVVKDDVVILPDKGEDIVDPVSSGQDSVENSGKRKLHEEVKITAIKYGTSIIQFFKDLIYKPRLPTDVYACTFLCDFINFFVLLFGFAAFGSQQGDGGVQAYLEENKVPIPFLIMLLIQFLLILIDRALYLRRALVYKIMFHFALVIGVHIWMFFVIPAVTERDFNSNLAPIIFYIIKCCGLLLSSYQIKCGYPSRILGNFLTRGFSLVNMIAFKIYMSMPFLYELRTFMDWVCTDSTMTLFDWLKMEDIFSSIFFLKCGRQMETDLPAARAQKKSIVTKIIMGGSIILLLIVLIWAPLTLFALANTVGQSNIPYDITISLKMGPYEPVYEMSAQDSSIHQFDDKMVGKFYEYFAPNKVAISFLLGYDSGDIAAMVLGANSTSLWSISPPDRERLLYDLIQNNTLTCRFKYTLTRKTNNQEKNPGVISSETTFEMDEYYPGRKKLISMLEGTNTTNDSIILPNIFPKFLKVKNSGTLGIIPQLLKPEIEYQNLYLKLFMSGDQNQFNSWWEVKEDCNGTDYQSIYSHLPYTQCSTNIVIYTFNDKLFSSAVSFLAAGGIVGMYTTFVIVAAKFLRGSISGTSKSIMFDELPYVDRVLQLCLDIYLVREALEFALEEDLFAKLLFLYRSPEMMIKWTRPKEENTDEDDEEETESVRSRTSRTSSRRRPE